MSFRCSIDEPWFAFVDLPVVLDDHFAEGFRVEEIAVEKIDDKDCKKSWKDHDLERTEGEGKGQGGPIGIGDGSVEGKHRHQGKEGLFLFIKADGFCKEGRKKKAEKIADGQCGKDLPSGIEAIEGKDGEDKAQEEEEKSILDRKGRHFMDEIGSDAKKVGMAHELQGEDKDQGKEGREDKDLPFVGFIGVPHGKDGMLEKKGESKGEEGNDQKEKVMFVSRHGKKRAAEEIVVEDILPSFQETDKDHAEIGKKKDIGSLEKKGKGKPFFLVMLDKIEESAQGIQEGRGKAGSGTNSDGIIDLLSVSRPQKESFPKEGTDKDGWPFATQGDADQKGDKAAEEDRGKALEERNLLSLVQKDMEACDISLSEGRCQKAQFQKAEEEDTKGIKKDDPSLTRDPPFQKSLDPGNQVLEKGKDKDDG